MSYEFLKYDFKCDLCNRAFSSKNALKEHKQNKNIDCSKFSYTYNLTCDVCKKPFKDSYKFKQHCLKKHNKTIKLEKQFNCNFCNKKFSSNSTLKRHCKTSCKIIKERKNKIEENTLNDFNDKYNFNKNIIYKNLRKENPELVNMIIDDIFKNISNYNIYSINNNQVGIYTKNEWVKSLKNEAYNKIIDDILDDIEENELNVFYEVMINKYNKINNNDNTDYKRIYLYTYIDDILSHLQKNNKINFI